LSANIRAAANREKAERGRAYPDILARMRWLPVIVLAALVPGAARAQFYDLDGAYHCVTAPDAACNPPAPTQPAPQPVAKEKEALRPPPTLAEAIQRVKKRAPEPADMHMLQERADAKDPRATEVLAWCALNGIGMKSDPLAAYWLYRDAAALGVANARKNQTAIYESRLSSDQRQQVLMQQNAH
jgi:TPR repeat protein